MKIYVASSWRNSQQPGVVKLLRKNGHEVYDFRNPEPGNDGFHWSNIDPDWQDWTNEQYVRALEHQVAETGFNHDLSAMEWADCFVFVMPCGRSAHLEAGWATGAGKPTIILLSKGTPAEPELMYKLADKVTDSMAEVLGWLSIRDCRLKCHDIRRKLNES